MKNMKLRLILLNFLEFAVWGAYLTSMGTYLATHGLATHIGWFYSIQGIVSLFMPALMVLWQTVGCLRRNCSVCATPWRACL